jgi:phage baseplate assembly protein W
MSATLGSGLAFPLGVDERGRLAMVSDTTDVEQAIGLIMDTAPGERPMRPDFGCAIHDLVFEGVDAETTRRIEDAVRAALERWEPRIVVEGISFDTRAPAVLRIAVDYRVKATNDVRNLVYPFYVIPSEEAP